MTSVSNEFIRDHVSLDLISTIPSFLTIFLTIVQACLLSSRAVSFYLYFVRFPFTDLSIVAFIWIYGYFVLVIIAEEQRDRSETIRAAMNQTMTRLFFGSLERLRLIILALIVKVIYTVRTRSLIRKTDR